uniref:Uncharacterized protein n=1 Tax=Octopus bimaculoides TaxID=37653 RepID=A0A0L8GB44_OCTBM
MTHFEIDGDPHIYNNILTEKYTRIHFWIYKTWVTPVYVNIRTQHSCN